MNASVSRRIEKPSKAASEGDLAQSLSRLESIGAVEECGIGKQRGRLTEAYVALAAKGESAIVVSQTRAEVKAINDSVRSRLRESGMLAGTDASVGALEQIDLTADGCPPLSIRELSRIQPWAPPRH